MSMDECLITLLLILMVGILCPLFARGDDFMLVFACLGLIELSDSKLAYEPLSITNILAPEKSRTLMTASFGVRKFFFKNPVGSSSISFDL